VSEYARIGNPSQTNLPLPLKPGLYEIAATALCRAMRIGSRIAHHREVDRAGGGGAAMILPGETEAALRGRKHAEG
jgi:hypothetical protein